MWSRLLLIVAATLVPLAAHAQSVDTGLAHIVEDLILTGIRLPGGAAPGNPHAGHFTLGDPTFGGSQAASRSDFAAIQAVEAFNERFTSQFANFPLGSSTGGFTFTFDEKTGAYSRGSASFGPAFTERARTIGRHKWSAGFMFQHSSFDTFGDRDLNDGSITFYLPHTDCCNAAAPPPSALNPGFEGDLVEASLVLKASTDTFALMASYGVTDRFDVGVALPINHVNLDATVNATILRLSTAGNPLVHTFAEGADQIRSTFTQSGSASGIGDIVLRSKYTFYTSGETGFAAAVDLRLPTGDEADLLGLGTTQAKVYAIASTGNDRFASHVNVGFTLSGTGDVSSSSLAFEPIGVSDEVNYAGGIEYVAHPRVTVIGDFIGRTLFDAGRVGAVTKEYQFRPGAAATGTDPLRTSTTNPVTGQPYEQLELTPGNLNLVLGAIGAKVNVAPNLLLSGHVLFPLTKGGLRDTATIAFGLDYAF
jgi:Putative MetA-pathway of phenol degradation